MKGIIVNIEQQNEIINNFNKLDEESKSLLYMMILLTEHEVPVRDLQTALGCSPRELSEFLQKFANLKLINICGFMFNNTAEVRQVILSEGKLSESILLRVMENLTNNLKPKVYKSTQEQKPFYVMTESLIAWGVKNEEAIIEWSLYGDLVYQFALQFHIQAHYEEDVNVIQDLLVIRALRLSRAHTTDNLARLMLLEAWIFVDGGFRCEACPLIEESEKIIKAYGLDTDEQVLLSIVKAVNHLSNGETLAALAHLGNAYEKSLAGDAYLNALICVLVSKELALIEDEKSARKWLSRVFERFLPDNSIKFYWYVINALLDADEGNAEMYFFHAKECIGHPEAPIWQDYYEARSVYFASHAQSRKSEAEYQKALLNSEKYCSTGAGFYLYRSIQLLRMVSVGNKITALHLSNDLDSVNLNSKDIPANIKLSVLEAYCEYHIHYGSTTLCKTYAEMGLDILNDYKVDDNTLHAVSKIFFQGRIPLCFSENYFYFQETLLKAEIKECQKKLVEIGSEWTYKKIYSNIRKNIKKLKEEMPDYKSELDLLAAHILSQYKPYKACDWMKRVVQRAKGVQRIKLAMKAANYISQIGFLWERKGLIELAVSDKYFTSLNRGLRALCLLELARITDEVGLRSEARKKWNILVDLTKGSELRSDVFYSHAVSAFQRNSYTEASMLMCSCISSYNHEDFLLDELLSGYYSFQSIIHSRRYRFQDCKTAVLRAMGEHPDLNSPSALSLYIHLAYYNVALNEVTSALEALECAKKFKYNDFQKKDIELIYELIALPWDERQRRIFHNSNIDADGICY